MLVGRLSMQVFARVIQQYIICGLTAGAVKG
jgi:hypothetical protein